MYRLLLSARSHIVQGFAKCKDARDPIQINKSRRIFKYEEPQIAVRIGDQKEPASLDAVVKEFGVPDIVLDDGSHLMADVAASFRYLYPRVAPDGVTGGQVGAAIVVDKKEAHAALAVDLPALREAF